MTKAIIKSIAFEPELLKSIDALARSTGMSRSATAQELMKSGMMPYKNRINRGFDHAERIQSEEQ